MTRSTGDGLAESSVRRFRCIPVVVLRVGRTGTPDPHQSRADGPGSPTGSASPRTEMYPRSGEEELERIDAAASDRDQRLADILLIAGWTGLRWSELRAVTGPRLRRGPDARRSSSSGRSLRVSRPRRPSRGRSRRVPVAGPGPAARPVPWPTGREGRRSAVRHSERPPVCTRGRSSAPLRWSTLRRAGVSTTCGTPPPCLWLASRGRPGHRPGVDGARVDRDDEPLPAPPRRPPPTGPDLARLNGRGHAGGTRDGAASE